MPEYSAQTTLVPTFSIWAQHVASAGERYRYHQDQRGRSDGHAERRHGSAQFVGPQRLERPWSGSRARPGLGGIGSPATRSRAMSLDAIESRSLRGAGLAGRRMPSLATGKLYHSAIAPVTGAKPAAHLDTSSHEAASTRSSMLLVHFNFKKQSQLVRVSPATVLTENAQPSITDI